MNMYPRAVHEYAKFNYKLWGRACVFVSVCVSVFVFVSVCTETNTFRQSGHRSCVGPSMRCYQSTGNFLSQLLMWRKCALSGHYSLYIVSLPPPPLLLFSSTPVLYLSPPLHPPPKGTCQKRFSGFCPLRGGGAPPLSAKEKNLLFRSNNSILCLFLCIFSPFWTIIWPFWPIFNLI